MDTVLRGGKDGALAEDIGRFFFLFLSLSTRKTLNNGSEQVSNHFAASK